jgi:hypothetical protein
LTLFRSRAIAEGLARRRPPGENRS